MTAGSPPDHNVPFRSFHVMVGWSCWGWVGLVRGLGSIESGDVSMGLTEERMDGSQDQKC